MFSPELGFSLSAPITTYKNSIRQEDESQRTQKVSKSIFQIVVEYFATKRAPTKSINETND